MNQCNNSNFSKGKQSKSCMIHSTTFCFCFVLFHFIFFCSIKLFRMLENQFETIEMNVCNWNICTIAIDNNDWIFSLFVPLIFSISFPFIPNSEHYIFGIDSLNEQQCCSNATTDERFDSKWSSILLSGKLQGTGKKRTNVCMWG